MVNFVNATYPCESCGLKIDTQSKFCPKCGAEQSPLDDKIQYNVFTRWKGSTGAFNEQYGAVILDKDFVDRSAVSSASRSSASEYYIGGYIPSEQPARENDRSYEYEMKVSVWIPVNEDGILGEDEGSQSITITMLE